MPELGKVGNAKVDFVNGAGSIAKMLLNNGMNPARLRTNATLLHEEWIAADKTILDISLRRMNIVKELSSRGLTYELDGLSKSVLSYQDASDIEDAQISMNPAAASREDRPEFDTNYLPLPVVHCGFSMNVRELNESRNGNMPLDLTMARKATGKVAEKIESMFMAGASTYTFGGGTIYGFQDFEQRNIGNITSTWTTGGNAMTDVIAMKAASITDRHYGPWGLYLPANYESKMDADYVSGYPKTTRSRILEVEGIEFVKVSDYLTASNIVMFELQPETVEAVIGLNPMMVEWEGQGGLELNFKILAIIVPRLRADQADRSGIMHWS
jgi:uncharacterized linocin/CFP29 family protein